MQSTGRPASAARVAFAASGALSENRQTSVRRHLPGPRVGVTCLPVWKTSMLSSWSSGSRRAILSGPDRSALTAAPLRRECRLLDEFLGVGRMSGANGFLVYG